MKTMTAVKSSFMSYNSLNNKLYLHIIKELTISIKNVFYINVSRLYIYMKIKISHFSE